VLSRATDLERARFLARQAVEVSQHLARDPAHSADVGDSLLLLAQGRRSSAPVTARRAAPLRAVRSRGYGVLLCFKRPTGALRWKGVGAGCAWQAHPGSSGLGCAGRRFW